MDDTFNILAISTLLIILTSLTASAYKTGLAAFSPVSLISGKQPSYTINKAKIKKFAMYFAGACVLNILYLIIFTREVEVIAIFCLLNMAAIGYALTFWILLEQSANKK